MLNPYTEIHRNCGRTTRMLEAAIKRAQQGINVVIVAANDENVRHLKWMLRNTKKANPLLQGYTFKTMYDSEVIHSGHGVRVNGFPKEDMFVDHFAVEHMYAEVINMYHYYG